MSDITKIKIDNEREHSYKDFPANREFKKRAEDDNPGGGWPSDLPKPSVGGYGYTTEQGEQTVIVDNESVTTVDDKGIVVGDFVTPFKIVDGAYTVIFNGTEYNLNSTFDDHDRIWYLGGGFTETGIDFSQYPFNIAERALFTESAGDYEVTVVKKPSETIHKIDEKYLPEGGFGWTEQGEQTVIVDNESITTTTAGGTGKHVGQFATPFKIVDGAYTVIFNGTEYNLNSTFHEELGFWYLGDMFEIFPDFSRYPFNIVVDDEGSWLITEFAGDYEVTVKKSSDIIHKIDEKYLPVIGGAMVVNFTVVGNNITADKTIEEVQTAMLTMPVVGVISFGDTSIAMGCAIGWYDTNAYYSGVAFMPLYSRGYADNSPHYMIRSRGNGWTSDTIES